MNYEPADLAILRRFALEYVIGKKTAKKHGISYLDLSTLSNIYALTVDAAKGVRISALVKTNLRARQACYLCISNLEQAGFIERRKRVKTAPFTLYITDSGFALLNHFLNALKRAEREKFGARPDKQAQAKGGRISRKPKPSK